MKKYILKRLLLLIPVVLGVILFVFTILYIAPGDPAVIIGGESASDQMIEEIRKDLGLDKPFIVQLLNYMKQVFIEFDFGESMITGVKITQELGARFPRTIILALASIVLSLLLGVPLGVNAAVHQNRPGDYLSMILALIGTSMPGFWLALMLVLAFALKLGWFPVYGIDDGIKSWILPVIANSFGGIATLARHTRSSMLDVLGADYIVMAKSKGLRERLVVYKHALPNALIPVITLASDMFGSMLGGALIIEIVFSIPGIGEYLVSGVENRDYYVVEAGVIILSVAFSVIMLVSDLLIALVDPRIKAQFAGDSKKRRKKNVNASEAAA